MRYYFGHDSNGVLISTEATTGGFSEEHRLDNPVCGHPLVDFHRKTRLDRNPEVVGFIGYDCPCDGDAPRVCGCACVNKKRLTGRVKDGKLVDKPTPIMTLDGIPVEVSEKPIVKKPGARVLIAFQVSEEAENSILIVSGGKSQAQLSLCLPKNLAVTKGITPTIELVVPAQGISSSLYVFGACISPLTVNFIGFDS